MERNFLYLKTSCYNQTLIHKCGMEIEWRIKNYEKVQNGQLVAYANVKTKWKLQIPVYSNSDGYCKILTQETIYNSNQVLGDIYIIDPTSFPNIPISTTDEFTGTTCIHWEKIGGYNTIGIPLTHNESDNLYLCAIYKDSKICLEMYFNSKVFKLKKGDTVSFKFSEGKIIDFTISTRPASVLPPITFPEENEGSEYREVRLEKIGYNLIFYTFKKSKYMKKVCFLLSNIDLQIFIQKPIESYRITYNSEGGATIDDVPYNQIMVTPICQEVIQDMFEVLVETVSKYDSAYAIDKLNTEQTESTSTVEFDYCYVYLMYDTNTGYYKIGMSNNPTYREGTLQSEKPTIKMLACHKYPSRKFAAAIEAALHNVYKDFHVRGEWYKLSKEDVSIIKEGLK